MKLQSLFINPSENRLRAGWRLTLYFCIQALGGAVGMAILTPLVIWMGRRGISALGFVLLATALGVTVTIFLARRYVDKRSIASLGLTLNRQAGRDLLFGLFLTLVMMGLIYLIEWAAGWLVFKGFIWRMHDLGRILRELLLMIGVVILVGWYEELLSRGYILQNLAEGLNMPWALLLSSGFFALAHYGNPNFGWAALTGLFLAGLFMAYGYVRTRSLWLPIGLHIGWNFFEGPIFGFPVSGMNLYRLTLQSVSGPPLWTGGDFGPEAGLVLLPALLLGTLAIYWYTESREQLVESC